MLDIRNTTQMLKINEFPGIRFQVKFKGVDGIIPYNYQYQLYSALTYNVRSIEHDEKQPKLFTFSKLFFSDAKFEKEGIKINKDSEIKLFFASYYTNIAFEIIENIISNNGLKLKRNIFRLKGTPIILKKENKNIFDTLSPITVSMIKNGKNYNPSPIELEFFELIKKNLIKKYRLIYGQEYHGPILFNTNHIHNVKSKRIKIKNTYHIGYELKGLEIIAPPEILNIVRTCGLGSKNSMGFGMVV